jgi:hypothetical protein
MSKIIEKTAAGILEEMIRDAFDDLQGYAPSEGMISARKITADHGIIFESCKKLTEMNYRVVIKVVKDE